MRRGALLFLILLMFISACGDHVGEMKKDVDGAARDINSYFKTSRNAVEKLESFLIGLYQNQTNYNISFENMDTDRGGKYNFQQGRQYHKDTNDGGCAVLVTLDIPSSQMNKIKKKIRLYENAEKLMTSLTTNLINLWILGNDGVVFLAPWADLVSTIPPNLDYRKIFWYYMADEKHDPGKKLVWTDEPFAELAGNGFIKVYMMPVYYNNVMEAAVTSDIYLTPIGRETLAQRKSPLLFISSGSTVIGANEAAIDIFKIKVLKEFEYLKQMSQNAFVPDEYKLTYKGNSQDIQDLGKKLVNSNEFDIKINGKLYSVYKKEIPDQPDLFVIGLVRK